VAKILFLTGKEFWDFTCDDFFFFSKVISPKKKVGKKIGTILRVTAP
jgi:hypothetical protein